MKISAFARTSPINGSISFARLHVFACSDALRLQGSLLVVAVMATDPLATLRTACVSYRALACASIACLKAAASVGEFAFFALSAAMAGTAKRVGQARTAPTIMLRI